MRVPDCHDGRVVLLLNGYLLLDKFKFIKGDIFWNNNLDEMDSYIISPQ